MFYGNADGFLTYLNERGREVSDDWDTGDINAALLVASEWLDNQYETSWIGYKKDFDYPIPISTFNVGLGWNFDFFIHKRF